MNTPVIDFIKEYQASDTTRMHMPGHKGAAFLGFEGMDITEIKGADSLYHADGIILESEKNATALFGTKRSLYSAEGSSLVIKAMLQIAYLEWKKTARENERPVVIAGRNAHVSFIHALALLDMDAEWIYGNDLSICACSISGEELTEKLNSIKNPVAVYITSPDYLGGAADIGALAKICDDKGTKLIVDNAHGAYLGFLPDGKYERYTHPVKAGAWMCSDSAHKTLPVLTGGAYLHMSNKCSDDMVANAKNAMALFGSTSPSYLIMASLDSCNQYISDGYREKLADYCEYIDKAKQELACNGWIIKESDPLKITVETPDGEAVAERLREGGIEPEYVDRYYVVLMLTLENGKDAVDKLIKVLGINNLGKAEIEIPKISVPERAMSVREAVLSCSQLINGKEAAGRICAAPKVICPPAIPVYVPGEVIDKPVEGEILCVR